MANLSGANLSGADLHGADLSDADLSDADLSDADLSDADLRAAKGVTTEQLEFDARTLEGATMPDGQLSWLYRSGLGEDGENSGPS